jgi:hypothetical protein
LSCLTPHKKSSTEYIHPHLLHKTDKVESDLSTGAETAEGGEREEDRKEASCWASEI